jgi:hypothetical protein
MEDNVMNDVINMIYDNEQLNDFVCERDKRIKKKVYVSARRGLKTGALCFHMARKAMTYKGHRGLFIAAYENMARHAAETYVKLMETQGKEITRRTGLHGGMITIETECGDVQRFISAVALSSGTSMLRGMRFNALYIDEPNNMNMNIYDILDQAMPCMLEDPDFTVMVAGTPRKGDKNLLLIAADPTFRTYHNDLRSIGASENMIDEMRESLSEDCIRGEVYGLFPTEI